MQLGELQERPTTQRVDSLGRRGELVAAPWASPPGSSSVWWETTVSRLGSTSVSPSKRGEPRLPFWRRRRDCHAWLFFPCDALNSRGAPGQANLSGSSRPLKMVQAHQSSSPPPPPNQVLYKPECNWKRFLAGGHVRAGGGGCRGGEGRYKRVFCIEILSPSAKNN